MKFESHLSGLDVSIVVAYFVIVFVIGIIVARKTESGDDLFLAGRKLTWLPIGFSLFASNISSTTLIGLCGAAYAAGISVANYEWAAALVLAFFAIFIAPIYIRSRIGTIPEYFERRFSRPSRVYLSGLTILTSVLIDTAGSLYAGSIVMNLFIPGISPLATAAILAAIAGVYTAAGGLAAVVYTDVLQAIVLFLGATFMTWTIFGDLDYSWARVVAETPPEMLSLIRPLDDPHLPWLGTLIGVPILGFYFWCTNQFIVQRVLGAKNIQHAQWGSILAGFLKLPVIFIMVLPGSMARFLLPEMENSDLVFPRLVMEYLPSGVVGLVLAGLIAAIMSSVDSTLNAASALITLDFVKPHRPNLTPKETATVGRITVILFMVASVLWTPVIAKFQGIFAYLQQMFSYLVPPVVAVILLGIFWKRTTSKSAFITLLSGHLLSLSAFVLEHADIIPRIHFTIFTGILCAASAVICVVTTLLTEADAPDDVNVLMFRWSHDAPVKAVWYQDIRVLVFCLVSTMCGILFMFW